MCQSLSLCLVSLVISFQAAGQTAPDALLRTPEARRQAIAQLEAEQQQLLATGEKAAAARRLNRIGFLHLALKDVEQAARVYEAARQAAQEAADRHAEADSLNGLAAAHLLLPQESPKTLAALRRALALSREANYPRGLAEAHTLLSHALWRDAPKASVDAAKTALKLWQELADRRGLARANYRLGEAYTILSEETPAQDAYAAALSLWREIDDCSEQASALVGLAYLEQRQGEWQQASAYLEQAKLLADEKTEPFLAGQIANGVGFLYENYEQPDLAEVEYQRGLRLYQQARNQEGEVGDMLILGRLQLRLGRPQEALRQIQEVLPRIVERGPFMAAVGYEFMGETYLALQDYEQAQVHLNRALSLFQSIPARREVAIVQTFLGQVYQAQGRLDEATRAYRLALGEFRFFHNRNNEAALLHALGGLETERGQMAAAGEYLRQSIKLTEQLRGDAASKDLRTSFLASVHNRYESYVDWLMRMRREPGGDYLAQAWEANEQGRARTLLEAISERARNSINEGADPALRAREQELARQMYRLENKLQDAAGKPGQQKSVAGLTRQLAAAQTQYDAAQRQLREKSPRYARFQQARALSLPEFRAQALDDETALLEYALGVKRSYLWVVTKDRIAGYDLPPQAEIEAAAEKLYGLISKPPTPGEAARVSQETEAAIADLSRLVWPAELPEVAAPRLVVVADGLLQRIPLGLLRNPRAPGEMLGERHEIVYEPSASALAESVRETAQRQSAPKVLAAFGDPLLPPYKPANVNAARSLPDNTADLSALSPLIFAKQEVDDIEDLLPAGSSFTALGPDATIPALHQTDLAQFQVLHLSTHALFDSERPERSGIVFSVKDRDGAPQEGFLRLTDVYNLRAPVDLVVLSACRTGLGRNVRGEGLVGLTHAFMYAGAASVMSSFWEVDDQATAELMKHTYEEMLLRGHTPAAALREAQQTMREKGWQAPYYWAAFTVHGQYRRHITPPPRHSVWAALTTPQIGVAALLLLSLSGGLVAWQRYRRRAIRSLQSGSQA
jgi:CHAT domain-containing protein